MRGRKKKERTGPQGEDGEQIDRQRFVAATLRHCREQRGWSQRDLAVYSRCSPETIAGVERGTVDPRLSTLGRIAQALGKPIAELVDPGKPLKA